MSDSKEVTLENKMAQQASRNLATAVVRNQGDQNSRRLKIVRMYESQNNESVLAGTKKVSRPKWYKLNVEPFFDGFSSSNVSQWHKINEVFTRFLGTEGLDELVKSVSDNVIKSLAINYKFPLPLSEITANEKAEALKRFDNGVIDSFQGRASFIRDFAGDQNMNHHDIKEWFVTLIDNVTLSMGWEIESDDKDDSEGGCKLSVKTPGVSMSSKLDAESLAKFLAFIPTSPDHPLWDEFSKTETNLEVMNILTSAIADLG